MLNSKVRKAMSWSLMATFGTLVLQLLFGIILARLLSPKEFGVMGIVLVVVTICKSLIDSGFYQALIQKKDASQEDFSAVFKFNLILSIIISLCIFFIAPFIAVFFESNDLIGLVRFSAILIVIESFSVIQKAYLVKQIKFKLISKIDLASILLSGVLAIVLAYNDFGVWSLVYKSVFQSLLITVFYWVFNPVSIIWNVSIWKIKGLFNFGFKVFIADQIENLSNQFTAAIVGRKFSVEVLGYFSKAVQYQNLVSQSLVVSINKVIFPTFSKIQDDDLLLKKSYISIIKLTTLFLFPLLLFVILVADSLIPFLIGNQWEESIPFFRILCIGGIFYPFTVYNLNIIKVKGFGSLYLKVCLVSKGILLPMVFIGSFFGIKGVLISIVLQQVVASVINGRYSGRLVGYSMLDQIKDVYVYLVCACCIFVILYCVKNYSMYIEMNDFITLIVFSILFFGTYLGILWLVKKEELLKIVKR